MFYMKLKWTSSKISETNIRSVEALLYSGFISCAESKSKPQVTPCTPKFFFYKEMPCLISYKFIVISIFHWSVQ